MKAYSLMLLLPLLIQSVFAINTDPLFSYQWGLKNSGQLIDRKSDALNKIDIKGIEGADIQWPGLPKFKKEVIVAVIDQGIDLEHPDLVDNIWKKEGPCFEGGSEKACYGWDFLVDIKDPVDLDGHGTHVSGIIGASSNDIGMTGVGANFVKIMPLKVLSPELKGLLFNKKPYTAYIAKAINFAIDNGAKVINMSVGWPKVIHGQDIESALQRAKKENVAVVVASGNNNKKFPVYPCSHESVICVGAMDNQFKRASFSNYSQKVDLYAPGEGILSTYPTKVESRKFRKAGYEINNGSSQAAPFVAGAIAYLIHESDKDLALSEIKAILYRNTLQLEDASKFGLVQLKSMLEDRNDRPFIDLSLKAIDEIRVRPTGSFIIDIPLEVLVAGQSKGKVELVLKSGAVSLKESVVEFDTDKDGRVSFYGKVLDYQKDSHIDFSLQITYGQEKQRYSGEIVLVRDISRELKKNDVVLKSIPSTFIGHFSSTQKGSRLKRVFDTTKKIASEQYFYFDLNRLKELRPKNKTPLSVLRLSESNYETLELVIPRALEVYGIFVVDINRNGEGDYLVYYKDREEKKLVFSLFNSKGEPLFGERSHWKMDDIGLDLIKVKNREEQIQLMKITTEQFGTINVPAFAHLWGVPKKDNSDDFFFSLPNIPKTRLYYMNPIVDGNKVEMELRTLENFDFISNLDLSLDTEFDLISLRPQSSTDQSRGSVKALYLKKSYRSDELVEVTFCSKSESQIRTLSLDHFILQNNAVSYTKDVAYFSTLYKRNKVRVFNEQGESLVFQTDMWSDPIEAPFDFINGQALIESRYYVWNINESGSSYLPINRESSFPGTSFSETFDRYQSTEGAALVVNSSYFVGDRVYVMKMVDGKFIRPISQSVTIPSECAVMEVHEYEGKKYKSFMCKRGRYISISKLEL
ncbi:S8 family serine peptidase [Halobacteriovorax sp. GB3]|uniref:S8 family serine peptidase n=1 Tax=Halobacteriovorax sp. GB3 TaxID=2719615 RepID=UPI00236216D1|nr:S8 family serine peptidase [Halobacteriovorax sp. GB3]MDD0852354.1 S8 family serine peptidase [Halobacteriovorax sp. GB3]